MKRLVYSTIAILALGSTVVNAGGVIMEPPSPPKKIIVNNDKWSGPYIGLQAGYIQGKADGEIIIIQVDPSFKGIKPKGFIGGIYAGYNKLLGDNWLAGIELTYNYTNIKKTTNLIDENGYTTSSQFHLKQKGEFALYAKFGKVIGDNDSTLVYGLAGATGTKLDGGYENDGIIMWDKDTVYGFTVGAGVEYKIDQNWHARVQYRFSKYKDAKYTFTNNITGKVKKYKTHSIMAGISYHFN